MARSPLDPPPWARGDGPHVAVPLDPPFNEGRGFVIACTTAGVTGRLLIRWRAHDPEHAEKTFREWLNQGWAVLNQTLNGEPGRYVFRTGSISGFIVLPD
jgi:hypothetical protein